MNDKITSEKELGKSATYGTSDHYKSRGLTRYTLILPETHKTAIETLAKKYKLSQGQIVEVLLEQMVDEDRLAPFFRHKAETKTDGRSKKHPKRELLKDMKDLTLEQLAQLAAQVAQMKGEKQ